MRYRSVLAAFLLAMLPAGCYSPSGGLYPSSNGTFTYFSTTTSPKSIAIIDIRSEEAFFTMDIPVGKQLTFKFEDGGGDDSIYTPDRMLWEVWELGTQTGRLTNQLTVPPASARRIQVSIRSAPEWPDQKEGHRMRIDEEADRPPHWTPEGGKRPVTTPIYDE